MKQKTEIRGPQNFIEICPRSNRTFTARTRTEHRLSVTYYKHITTLPPSSSYASTSAEKLTVSLSQVTTAREIYWSPVTTKPCVTNLTDISDLFFDMPIVFLFTPSSSGFPTFPKLHTLSWFSSLILAAFNTAYANSIFS